VEGDDVDADIRELELNTTADNEVAEDDRDAELETVALTEPVGLILIEVEREEDAEELIETDRQAEDEFDVDDDTEDEDEGVPITPLTFLGIVKDPASLEDRYRATLFHCPQF
jgi:hypothetical protein